MAFPKGANINDYKDIYLDQMDSSSSSDGDLGKKAAAFLPRNQRERTSRSYDWIVKSLKFKMKQRNIMVKFNELEEELQQLKRDRKKVLKRLNEDKVDFFTKARAGLNMPITMAHREAIQPPTKKKKATPIIESASSSSSSSSSSSEEEAEEDNGNEGTQSEPLSL